jgi:hypothetical protein
MFALIVLWDLSGGTKTSIDELRTYIRDESLARFSVLRDMRLKVWISNEATGRWGAFYLFDTRAAAEAQASTVTRPEQMTGVTPTVEIFEMEAAVEGIHTGADLLASGLVWRSPPAGNHHSTD